MDICFHFSLLKIFLCKHFFMLSDYFFRVNFFLVKLLGQRLALFKTLTYIVKLLTKKVLIFTPTIRI